MNFLVIIPSLHLKLDRHLECADSDYKRVRSYNVIN